MNILITGGAGFIGSNFLRATVKRYPEDNFINLDILSYAGNLSNLKEVENEENYFFEKGSILDKQLLVKLMEKHGINTIVNFAAESHVDRSIENPYIFTETNVNGTQILLEVAREYKVDKFLQVSTDEVYGTLGKEGLFTEKTPLQPNSPYSASKAGADLLVRAYHETYSLNTNITRCSNNYGPFQFPEKLIPLMISNGIEGKELPIYGDGKNIRDWLHVQDHCDAINLVLRQGRNGETYNIGGNSEKTNLEVVNKVIEVLDISKDKIKFIQDRLGHDRRYAIDASKIEKELDWSPKYNFDQGMKETIKWYQENQNWWEEIKSGEYLEYYKKQYEGEKNG